MTTLARDDRNRAAAFLAPEADAAPLTRLRLREFREFKRGALDGFATFELPAIGLTIRDCPVMTSHGRTWIGLPAKAQIGSDGIALRDEHGKIKYAVVIEWRDRELQNRFSAAAVKLIKAKYPDAFGELPLGEPAP